MTGTIESVTDEVKVKVDEAVAAAKAEADAKLQAAKADYEAKLAARAASKPWTLIGYSALAGALIGFALGAWVF